MENLFLGAIVLIFILYLIFGIKGNSEELRAANGSSTSLENKDPMENKCDGENSTNWKYVNVCNKCLSFVSVDERLTEICLSCGEHFDWSNSCASTRKIVRGKKWVTQVRYRGKNYINKVLYKNEPQ